MERDFPGQVYLSVHVKSLDFSQSAQASVAFVDPCSNLALLSDPLHGGEDSFWDLLSSLEAVPIRHKPLPANKPIGLHVFTCRGRWLTGKATLSMAEKLPSFAAEFSVPILGGTSGSPVLDDDGFAVGVVYNSGQAACLRQGPAVCGMVHLPNALPSWAAAAVAARKKTIRRKT
jgi:hypothetical protein